MKTFLAILLSLACLTAYSQPANRFPLSRSYLQTPMDGNGQSATNLSFISSTSGIFTNGGAVIIVTNNVLNPAYPDGSLGLRTDTGSPYFHSNGVWNLFAGGGGGGGGSTPTGTGVRKVASGVENAAASPVGDADVSTISVGKIAGALAAANNLSDVANAATARGNLGAAPAARSIATTAPLTGGGDLSADRTLAMAAATGSVDGYLSHLDWSTFNGKQAALGYTPANIANNGSDFASPSATVVNLGGPFIVGIGTNSSTGNIVYTNTTAAVTGTQQDSPSAAFYGQGFLNAGGLSQTIGFLLQEKSVKNNLNGAGGYLRLYSTTNGSTPVAILDINTAGGVTNVTVNGIQSRSGYGNTTSIYVDPVLGDDSTGARGGRAFKTLAAGAAVAVAGDVITAAPGAVHSAGAVVSLLPGVTLSAYGATIAVQVYPTNNCFMLGGYYTVSPHWNVLLSSTSGTNFNYSQDLLVRGASGDGLIIDHGAGLMRWNSCDFASQWDAGLLLDSETNMTAQFFNCSWQSGGYSPWAGVVTDGFHGFCWTLGSGVNEGGKVQMFNCAISVLNSTNQVYTSPTLYMNGNACFYIAAQGSGAGAPSFTGTASAELYNCVFNYGSTNAGVVTLGVTNSFSSSIPIRGYYFDNPAGMYQSGQNASYTLRYLGTDMPVNFGGNVTASNTLAVLGTSAFTGNAAFSGSANTAASQVFGANNLLTGTLGDARYGVLSGTLGQFAATTSAQLFGVISDETGSGKVVGSDSPVFTTLLTTPALTITGGAHTGWVWTDQGSGVGAWAAGAGGSQTPWTGNIEAAGNNLSHVNTLSVTNQFISSQYAEFDGYGTNLWRSDPTNGVAFNTPATFNKSVNFIGNANFSVIGSAFWDTNSTTGSYGMLTNGSLTLSNATTGVSGIWSNSILTTASITASTAVTSKQYLGTQPSALATTGTVNIDWSTGTHFNLGPLTGSVTFTFSNNSTDTEQIVVTVTGDASHTITWPTAEPTKVHWPAGTSPTQTLSKTDIYTIIRTGGTNYGSFIQNY